MLLFLTKYYCLCNVTIFCLKSIKSYSILLQVLQRAKNFRIYFLNTSEEYRILQDLFYLRDAQSAFLRIIIL